MLSESFEPCFSKLLFILSLFLFDRGFLRATPPSPLAHPLNHRPFPSLLLFTLSYLRNMSEVSSSASLGEAGHVELISLNKERKQFDRPGNEK